MKSTENGEQPKASAGVVSCRQPASAERALVNGPGQVGKVGAFCACRRLVVLVGQRKALAIAVKGSQTKRRWSKLRVWLAGGP